MENILLNLVQSNINIYIRYIGEIKYGLRHGQGKFITQNEVSVYEGNWKDGLKNGYGVLTVKDNYKFEGQWKEGVRHGFGKITWNNGNVFEGFL